MKEKKKKREEGMKEEKKSEMSFHWRLLRENINEEGPR